MIETKNMVKIYKGNGYETKALDEVSIRIEDGDFVAIIGESGSGKSTLLNILGGMDTMTSGEFYFDELPIHKLTLTEIEKIRSEKVSFVFQNFALMDKYNAFENIEMPLRAKNIKKSERVKRVNAVAKELGIDNILKKLPSQISGGQQQRVAIARALVMDNSIVLADEPTGALDKKNTEELMNLISYINQKKKTIILITHSMDVAKYANKIIELSDGKII